MDKPTIATIRGTMIAPGVSKNLRLYTKEAIGRMVTRAQARINNPDAIPISMRTHHAAGDNSLLTVGRITNISQAPDGSAQYEAKLYNTKAGRDMAVLLGAGKEPAALKNTSIFGYWVGSPDKVKHNGESVETANDLEVDFLDFTGSPGVSASRVSSITMESTLSDQTGRAVISETVDGTLELDNPDTAVELDTQRLHDSIMEYATRYENHGLVDEAELDVWERTFNTKQRKQMAASGQAMPGGRYPIANKSDLRNAIRAVGRGTGSHDAIRRHIIKRAKALGLSNLIPPGWSASGTRKENTMADGIGEHYIKVCVGDIDGDMLKVCADNLHPDVLKDAIKKAGKLIDQIIGQDGADLGQSDEDDMIDNVDDIDWKVITCTPAGDDYDTDQMDSMPETESVTRIRRKMREARKPHTTTNTTKESTVDDTTKDAVQAAPGLSEADMVKLAALIGEAVKGAVTEAVAGDMTNAATAGKTKNKKNKKSDTSDNGPATGENASTTDTVKETGITTAELDKKLAETREAAIAEMREQILKENGIPSRKGYRHVAESDEGKQVTGDELWDKRSEVWRSVAPALYANTSQLVPTAPAA